MLRNWISALKLSALFAGLATVSPLCMSQTADQARRVGQYYAHTEDFSGNVVVVREGVIVSNNSYGKANVELGVPNTANTRYAVGSVSKQFTAAAILLLQEQGLLKTTDTLAEHYPQTPAAWKDITLRQLLQHTSGIPDGINVWGISGTDLGEPTPGQVVASVTSKPLVFQPGSRWEYNNTGYILLGLVVEKVSGQSLADFLQKHFFIPLQMRDTGLASSREIIPHMATGYSPMGQSLRTSIAIPFTSLFAAGAIYSTGEDLAKWLTALHTGKVLKPESYAEMASPDSSRYAHAYGLNIDRQSGHLDIGHNGKVPGFGTETDFYPDTKTGIIILSNKLGRDLVSTGENALETDLMRIATEQDAAVRSLGGERHIPPATLARYTGTYPMPGANPVIIELHQGHLFVLQKDRPTTTLIARSDHEFYTKEWDGEVEFHQDHDGSWLMDLFLLPRQQALMNMKQTTPAPH